MIPPRLALQSLRSIHRSASSSVRRKMSTASTPLLVSPQELGKLFESTDDVVTLDATWFMPNVPRNPLAEFRSKRLPRARYLDLDEVASSHPLGLKHMMPDGKTFGAACGKSCSMPFLNEDVYVEPSAKLGIRG